LILNRDAFLAAAAALPTTDIPVPEFGDGSIVRLAVMTGAARDKWDLLLSKRKDDYSGLKALLVALCAVDEAGAALFTEADVAAIGGTNGAVLERLYRAAWTLNKLGSDDLEGAAKN
jgi:hypothetical protein